MIQMVMAGAGQVLVPRQRIEMCNNEARESLRCRFQVQVDDGRDERDTVTSHACRAISLVEGVTD